MEFLHRSIGIHGGTLQKLLPCVLYEVTFQHSLFQHFYEALKQKIHQFSVLYLEELRGEGKNIKRHLVDSCMNLRTTTLVLHYYLNFITFWQSSLLLRTPTLFNFTKFRNSLVWSARMIKNGRKCFYLGRKKVNDNLWCRLKTMTGFFLMDVTECV